MLAVFVGIAYASKIDFTNATLLEPLDSLIVVALSQSPKMGKVVHQTIWYNTKSNTLAYLAVGLHKTIDSIVEGRVATYNNNSLIAIVYHHLNKTIYT